MCRLWERLARLRDNYDLFELILNRSAVFFDQCIHLLMEFPDGQRRASCWPHELMPEDFVDLCCTIGANTSLSIPTRCAYVALLQTYCTWLVPVIPPSLVEILLSASVFQFTAELLEASLDTPEEDAFVVEDPDLDLEMFPLSFQDRIAVLWSRILIAAKSHLPYSEAAQEDLVASKAFGVIEKWSSVSFPAQDSRGEKIQYSSKDLL